MSIKHLFNTYHIQLSNYYTWHVYKGAKIVSIIQIKSNSSRVLLNFKYKPLMVEYMINWFFEGVDSYTFEHIESLP